MPRASLGNNVRLTGSKAELSNCRMAIPLHDPIALNIPTYDGSNEPMHPSVIHLRKKWNGYSFWMAMTPYPGSNSDYENPSILASNDGINWVVPNGLTNPIAPQPASGWYADTSLIYDRENNRLMLWWSQLGITPSKEWLSTSLNGVTWSVPVECTGAIAGPKTINYLGADKFEAIRLQGAGNSGLETSSVTASWAGVRYVSSDGVTWSKSSYLRDKNFLGVHWHANCKRFAEGYHILTSAHPESANTEPGVEQSLYYGYSKDGNDIVFQSVPILMGSSNNWPETTYMSDIIALEDNKYRVYVSGHKNNVWGIRYFDMIINNPERDFDIFLNNANSEFVINNRTVAGASGELFDKVRFVQGGDKIKIAVKWNRAIAFDVAIVFLGTGDELIGSYSTVINKTASNADDKGFVTVSLKSRHFRVRIRNHDSAEATLQHMVVTAMTTSVDADGDLNPRVIYETVYSGQLSAGATSPNFSLNFTGNELSAWILVNIDKQPWSFSCAAANTSPGGVPAANLAPIYPLMSSKATTHASLNAPATAFYFGLRSDGTGLTAPSSMTEAKNMAVPPVVGVQGNIVNNSAETATITVRVMKIMR